MWWYTLVLIALIIACTIVAVYVARKQIGTQSSTSMSVQPAGIRHPFAYPNSNIPDLDYSWLPSLGKVSWVNDVTNGITSLNNVSNKVVVDQTQGTYVCDRAYDIDGRYMVGYTTTGADCQITDGVKFEYGSSLFSGSNLLSSTNVAWGTTPGKLVIGGGDPATHTPYYVCRGSIPGSTTKLAGNLINGTCYVLDTSVPGVMPKPVALTSFEYLNQV